MLCLQLIALIAKLEVLNANPEVNKGEIEKMIAGAARTFSVVDGFTFPGEPVRAAHFAPWRVSWPPRPSSFLVLVLRVDMLS